MFKAKRTFGSLFVSCAVHLIGFVVLGLIFLKAKPYEEYIEATFVDPLPQKRKIRMRKAMIRMIPSADTSNIMKPLPQITTAVKIGGVNDVGFGLSAPVTDDAPLSDASAIQRRPFTVTVASPSVRPKVNSSPFRLISAPAVANMDVLSPSTVEDEMKLLKIPNINIRETTNVGALRQYCEEVKRKIEKEKEYPTWAERNGYEGQVDIRFKILSDGQVENVEIVNSSGYDILDKEAIRTIQEATPYPPIPKVIAKAYLWIKVPLVFELQERKE